MRTLTDTLKAAQQAGAINALVKLVLTHNSTTYTYTKTRILDIKETGDGSLQFFELFLNNADKSLTDLDFQGYKGVLSYGAITTVGEEYSALAPMWVKAQQFGSDPDKLECKLSLVGICNLMAEDEANALCTPKREKYGTATSTIANHLIDTGESQFKASDVGRVVHNTTDDTYASITEYNSQSNLTLDADIMVDGEDYEIWTEGSNDTVKTLVNAIAGATLTCFSHCKAYEVVWEDGYDALADTYRPKDAFRIYTGNNRNSAIDRLLEYTLNVKVVKADGKIHIFKPTTSGTTYDSEYSLESGHPFFAKALRKRVVTPNYIKVQSREDDDPRYSGTAQDESYPTLPDELKKHHYKQTYLESDEQATAIAEAILARAQMWCEAGAANVPMNVGTEVFDYVKVTDSREEDSRVGNIGRYVRYYDVRKNEWRMTFDFGNWQNVRKVLANLNITGDDIENYFSRLSVGDLYVENILAENVDFVWIDPEGNIDLDKIGDTLDHLADGETYGRVKTLHLDAGQVKLDEYIYYAAGYNPTDKFDLNDHDLDNIADGTVFQRVKSASLTAAGLVLLDQVVVGTYGLIYSADISAHHILLSKTTKDGAWYQESGVGINADVGIGIYGGEGLMGLRTYPTLADYLAGTNVQCYIGTDGKFYAGGGKVYLDELGLWLKGQYFFIQDSNGVTRGHLFGGTENYVQLQANQDLKLLATADIIIDTDSLQPVINDYVNLGTTSKQFYGGYFASRLKMPVGTNLFD